MKRIALAVFDLDNTLYDWYSAFIPAFYAMVDEAAARLDCDRAQLLNELKAVHVKHRDVEHPFALIETATVQHLMEKNGPEEIWHLLDPAFHVFNKVRKERLKLFPQVCETLVELQNRNIKIVAFTDSKYFAAIGRVKRLGLEKLFDRIYCREKGISALPNLTRHESQVDPAKVRELPATDLKPNPRTLLDIAMGENVDRTLVAYIGDSLSKDVLMAQQAGVYSIWAKYGAHTNDQMYDDLIRISHWMPEDIAREQAHSRKARGITPDFVCERTISDILNAIEGPADIMVRRDA